MAINSSLLKTSHQQRTKLVILKLFLVTNYLLHIRKLTLKIKKMKILLISLVLTLSILSQAQNVDFKKKSFSSVEDFNTATDALEKGNDFFFAGNFEKALPRFLDAQKLNPSNSLLNFKIGACYLKNDELKKSTPYFETAKRLDPKVDPKIDFALASSYQANGRYDEAVESYLLYLASLSKNKKLLEEPNVQKQIDICSTEIQKKQTKIEEEKELAVKEEKAAAPVAPPVVEAKAIEEVKEPAAEVVVPVAEVKKEEPKIEPKAEPKKVAPAPIVATPVAATSSKITYRIQITSTSHLANSAELEKVYSGNLKITHQKVGNLYKYFVGDFSNKSEALKARSTAGVNGAFIVKFKDGKKI